MYYYYFLLFDLTKLVKKSFNYLNYNSLIISFKIVNNPNFFMSLLGGKPI